MDEAAVAVVDPAAAVDAAALPTRGVEAPASDDPRIRYLVQLWSELLDVPVKPEDNFFELGGNSMLGVQMAERVARDTGMRIKLVRLAAQDLAQIAADLPASFGSESAAGLGGRLARGVKRLFGRPGVDTRT